MYEGKEMNGFKSRLFFVLVMLVVLFSIAYLSRDIEADATNSTQPEMVPGLIYQFTDEHGRYIYKKEMVPRDATNVNDYTNSVRMRNYIPRTRTF